MFYCFLLILMAFATVKDHVPSEAMAEPAAGKKVAAQNVVEDPRYAHVHRKGHNTIVISYVMPSPTRTMNVASARRNTPRDV